MAFEKLSQLNTFEPVFGAKRIGQVISVPPPSGMGGGRLDKVSALLIPTIGENGSAAQVVLEAYDVYDGIPVGPPLASDSVPLSDIAIKGYVNFQIEADVPTVVALVLSVPSGDENNHVEWVYETTPNSLGLLTSDGVTWRNDPTRIFSYIAFSLKPDAVDPIGQTALVGPGTLQTIPDDHSYWQTLPSGDFWQTEITTGDTIAINFGNFVVTLVVDQSGSMTWNDANGVRFDFLKNLIADIDTKLADYSPSSSVSYSILKFRGRRIGSLTIGLQGTASAGFEFDGVRVFRSTEGYPSTPSGYLVYDGLPQSFFDRNLVPGTTYYYAAFAYGNFSTGQTPLYSNRMIDYGQPTSPPTAPVGVAGLAAKDVITDQFGGALPSGNTDFGYRKVSLTWLNPKIDPLFTANAVGYVSIVLVRRDDRPPDSPDDGTVLLTSDNPTANVSFVDDFDGTYEPVNGLTYYYGVFTIAASGVKCARANAASVSVAINVPDRPWEKLAPPGNVAPVGFKTSPPAIPTYSITVGNATMGLSWNAGSPDTALYKLFYNETSFPLPTDEQGTNYTGTLLYTGTGAEMFPGVIGEGEYDFVHRFLDNDQPCFYVLVAYDRMGNAAAVKLLTANGVPPQPSAAATTNFPPPSVTGFSAEVVDGQTNLVRWANPVAPAPPSSFWFDDTVGVVSTVEFVDQGTYDTSIMNLTYKFVVDKMDIAYQQSNLTSTTTTSTEVSSGQLGITGENAAVLTTTTTVTPIVAVDPNAFILFANVPATGVNSIMASLSISPQIDLRNLVSSASITLHAALMVQNQSTGEIVAEVYTDSVGVTWNNPFAIKIESSQTVGTPAAWGATGQDPETGCVTYGYPGDSASVSTPGVYVLSDEPFRATIEVTYEGQAIPAPVPVTGNLTDASTGLPTSLVSIPGSLQNSLTVQTQLVSDETLDRSGQPTGATENRSLVQMDLPPCNIPGNLVLSATATYNGYQQTASISVAYASCLNIDLNLAAFQPDQQDSAEQSAFVYFLIDGNKVPVPDFTVTNWAISPTCPNSPTTIPGFVSRDDVPGVGVNAYTRGGLASKIFWGPGTWPVNTPNETFLYQVSVTAQANGMTATGHGTLQLSPPASNSLDRIFLRGVTSGISFPTIFADGVANCEFEVIADPANEGDPGDISSGKFFWNAVVNPPVDGTVPALAAGQVVTMTTQVVDNSGVTSGTGTLLAEAVAKNLIIKTNISPNGVVGSAAAKVEDGVALFTISCDAAVPPVNPNQQETMASVTSALTSNRIYGIPFDTPKAGIYVVLTVRTGIEINGQPVSFTGGGSDLINSSPPMFLALMEPLGIS